MTRYIIMTITALLLVSCNDNSAVKVYNKGLKHTNIPIECYDTNGNFDSNRGHDALDCDNL